MERKEPILCENTAKVAKIHDSTKPKGDFPHEM